MAGVAQEREGSGASSSHEAPGNASITWLRGGTNVALVVALVGMVTGVTSLYISWRSTTEQAEVRLSAYPTASPDDITPQGLGIRVVLVNESLRPIVLRSAALLLDGATVAQATGWIDDVRLLDSAASDPSSVSAAQQTFPIGLAEREGKSVAFIMDVWTPFVDASSDADKSAARAARSDSSRPRLRPCRVTRRRAG